MNRTDRLDALVEERRAVTCNGGSVVAEPHVTSSGLTFGCAADPDESVFGVWYPPAG